MLLNNLYESFNFKIVDARDKSILTMCEMIRRYLMKKIPRNRDTMLKKSSPICPKITRKQLGIALLHGLVDRSLKCIVKESSL